MDKQVKRINEDQVEALYAFTRQHYVEYYDLQTELVDHLANAIEARWQQQPQLSFDEAVSIEFKKFGIFGFMDVVEKRQLALGKKYYTLLWNYLKIFLRLPQIIFTTLLVVFFYEMLQLSAYMYAGIFTFLLLGSWVRLMLLRWQYNKKVKLTGKKWLLEDTIFSCGGFGVVVNLPLQMAIHLNSAQASPIVYWIMATVIVLLLLYNYVVLFLLPAKAEKHLMALYPEYKFEFPS